MSSILDDEDRRVIPRWREFRATADTGELDDPSARSRTIVTSDVFFEEKLEAWSGERSVATAADLVGAALVLGREAEAIEAARLLLDEGCPATSMVKSLAKKCLMTAGEAEYLRTVNEPARPTGQSIQDQVRYLRASLRDDPRNSLMWVDLSRAYATVAQEGHAVKAMSNALKLSPDNRFVLRSAARLFVHLGEPDRAHEILRRNESTKEDPWLLSAEIAVASVAGRRSRFIRRGQGIVKGHNRRPFETTELASALGTVELVEGNLVRARKLFRRSLVRPTDNSVAQAGWAARRITGVSVDPGSLRTPRSFEARAWEAFLKGDWGEVVSNCELWLTDEPFSSRPALLGSYVAAVPMRKFDLCETFALRGLSANPGEMALANNLVVALANLERVEQAKVEFKQIPRPADEPGKEAALLATEGLLNFRSGNLAEGRVLYMRAIELARGRRLDRVRALAALHLAREEINANSTEVGVARKRAMLEAKGINDADVVALIREIQT